MGILEIKVKNPINTDSIELLILEIQETENYRFLLIDTGDHDFFSIEVIKYFKEEIYAIETHVRKFEKVAFIHPPHFRNESEVPEKYEYFSSKEEAVAWLLLS